VLTQETNATLNGNDSTHTETRLWADFENDRLRREVVESSYGSEMITVRNETGTITYTPSENQYNQYNMTSNVSTTVTQMAESAEFEYEGRETVDSNEVYRLHVIPNTTTSQTANVTATVWIDTETYFPTKATSEFTTKETSYETTMRFSNVSLNEELADSRFTLDLPANASEPDPRQPEQHTFDSLSAVRSNAEMTVPSPDVPEDYEFESAYLTEGDDYSLLNLRYTNGSEGDLSVSKRAATGYNYSDNDDFEAVDIGDRTGWYNEFSGTSVLAWECGDHSYTIYGDLSKEETIDVAESIDCE
jgi:outer membrane lipoprotein-sorting protein